MALKDYYEPSWAEQRVREHAQHFVRALEVTSGHRQSMIDADVTISLPFDTELFGHWWFEGPAFLEEVLRGIHGSPSIHSRTASESVDASQASCLLRLPESSWGRNGTDEVWMNAQTQWTWEREYRLEHRLRHLREKHHRSSWDGTMERIMHDLYREMLLLQASDWQFLITTETARDYASMRFAHHAADVERLCDLAERYMVAGELIDADRMYLDEVERRDGIFPELLNVID
jgi:1,4-alpha-glucan branching enzyme